jgi:hypothetical protein
MGPPPLDTKRVGEIIAMKEEDLSLLSLQRLTDLGEELDRISVEASGVLTHALMTREKEGQDKEVYNGMIQVRSSPPSHPSFCSSYLRSLATFTDSLLDRRTSSWLPPK